MNEKLVGTITVEMNKYICNEEDYEWFTYRETDKSFIKRVADTFGFDSKRIILKGDQMHYSDGLCYEAVITVCGFDYEVNLQKNTIFKW